MYWIRKKKKKQRDKDWLSDIEIKQTDGYRKDAKRQTQKEIKKKKTTTKINETYYCKLSINYHIIK